MQDLGEIQDYPGSRTNNLINILGELRWVPGNWKSHEETVRIPHGINGKEIFQDSIYPTDQEN